MANPPPPKMPPPPKKPVAAWRLKVAKALPGLFAAFVVGGMLQVFLAGYGLDEVGYQGMDAHVGFGLILHFLPVLIAIVGFVGADWRAGVTGVVMAFMFELQFMFIGADQPGVRALHVVNGVAMILVALVAFLHRWQAFAKAAPVREASASGVVQGTLRQGPPT